MHALTSDLTRASRNDLPRHGRPINLQPCMNFLSLEQSRPVHGTKRWRKPSDSRSITNPITCSASSAEGGASMSMTEPAASGALGIQTAEPYITHSWMWRGHNIHYAVAGCGKPVLLVHGFGASLGHWRKNVPALAQNHKVYAIDLLGFGKSDKPLLSYNMELWRDQVLDFIAEFMQQPVVLVGNSLGSLACLMVNAVAPEGAVRGTIMLNCAGGMNNKAIADDWRIKLAMPGFVLIDYLLSQQRIARFLFDKFRTPKNIRDVLLRVYGDPESVDDALVDLIYTPSSADGALEAFVSIITGPPGPRPETLMDNIKGPLLIMWGDKDPFTPVDGPVGRFLKTYSETREECDFVILPDTGHCPHDDRPQLVNAELNKWLATYH